MCIHLIIVAVATTVLAPIIVPAIIVIAAIVIAIIVAHVVAAVIVAAIVVAHVVVATVIVAAIVIVPVVVATVVVLVTSVASASIAYASIGAWHRITGRWRAWAGWWRTWHGARRRVIANGRTGRRRNIACWSIACGWRNIACGRWNINRCITCAASSWILAWIRKSCSWSLIVLAISINEEGLRSFSNDWQSCVGKRCRW